MKVFVQVRKRCFYFPLGRPVLPGEIIRVRKDDLWFFIAMGWVNEIE